MRWWERVGSWDDSHRFGVDAAATVLIALVVVPTATLVFGVFGNQPLLAVFSVALCVPLAWRRTHPAASAGAVYAAALLHLLLGIDLVVPADLAVLLALYSVTVHGEVWAYRVAIAGALLGAVLLGLAVGLRSGDLGQVAVVAVLVGLAALTVFGFALVRRSRREHIDALTDRARRLEVERDQQAQLATAAERARIAREMHDIVAHSLSVIIAQADGGRYAAAADPDAATRSLTTIGETGRAALADMRRLLGVLRPAGDLGPGTGDAGGASSPAGAPAGSPRTTAPADLTPQPAVADLGRLVEQVRASGVRVSLVRTGVERPLPPGTGLTVYRICQESLTNVLKHAGPGPTVTVLVQWTAAALVLEVIDDGRGAAAQPAGDGAGQGLVGMRERATMLGGTLSAGPRPGGGFRVRAEIPLPRVAEPQPTPGGAL